MPQLKRASAARGDPPREASLIMSPGARSIVQAALRDEVSVAELAERACADPAFVLRVLSVANSAAYSPARPITNVHHACSLLGVRAMRNIALGMVVADLVPAAEGAAALLSNCLRRAVAARELACCAGGVDPDDAFFTGLLLEVGLLHQACDEFEACTQVARTPARHRGTVERALGLTWHPVMGALLARDLGLPDAMVQAIAEHQAVQKPEEALAAVCWAAEHVAATLEGGDTTRNMRLAERACTSVSVSAETMRALLERIPDEVHELAVALESAPASSRRVPSGHQGEDELLLQYEDLVRVIDHLLDQRDLLRQELSAVHESR